MTWIARSPNGGLGYDDGSCVQDVEIDLAGDELVMHGAVVGPRTWMDVNRDGIPDCGLTILGKNAECGSVIGSEQAVTLRATRR